jgi:Protein of unknown function (DUF1183).
MHSSVLLLALVVASCHAAGQPITLSDVKVLYFKSGEYAVGYRTDTVPSIVCEGPLCQRVSIQEVKCFNSGLTDENDGVIWDCITDLDERYEFEGLGVRCEGWDDDNDVKVVVEGSCQMVYTLHQTDNQSPNVEDDVVTYFTTLEIGLFIAAFLLALL